jgi:hypothetical protein
MRFALALFCYAAALFFVYAGFNVPGSEGLGHHVRPANDQEMVAALLIVSGMGAKLLGHVFLLSTTRARVR